MRRLLALWVLTGCIACGSSGSTTGAAGHGGAAATAETGGASAMAGHGGVTGTAGAGGVAAPAGPRVSDFLGINGFIDDPTEKLAAVGNVREYHDWSWNDGNGAAGYPGYPNNQLSFSLFSGFWDFDAYYAALGQAGAMVFPCVEGSVDYLANAMPPVPAGADVKAPASYVAHASFMYQLAARYGTQAVPTANLKLASDQTRQDRHGPPGVLRERQRARRQLGAQRRLVPVLAGRDGRDVPAPTTTAIRSAWARRSG